MVQMYAGQGWTEDRGVQWFSSKGGVYVLEKGQGAGPHLPTEDGDDWAIPSRQVLDKDLQAKGED